ncbi:MAG: hypothetical protein JNK78_15180, partial [Planctomycetes bacterium]|nr:hypothetical protein [Planctomycetota bacterium]
MVHAPQSREWFMAIPSWSPRQRRCAQGAGLTFLGVLVLGLSSLLWPRPASEAPPALLPPTAASLTSGEWLRSFERYCKESAGVTRGLRAVNDLAMAALGLAPPPMLLGRVRYESENGEPLDGSGMVAAIQRGFFIEPPWPEPRTRPMVAPNQFFYLAYSDHERLRRPWFDERGRVAVKLNRFAIRDREDLTEKKQP